MYGRGRRCHWWDLIFRPAAAGFKSLVIKGGILDGTWGLLIAQKAMMGAQLKYAALWAVQNETRQGDPTAAKKDNREGTKGGDEAHEEAGGVETADEHR